MSHFFIIYKISKRFLLQKLIHQTPQYVGVIVLLFNSYIQDPKII